MNEKPKMAITTNGDELVGAYVLLRHGIKAHKTYRLKLFGCVMVLIDVDEEFVPIGFQLLGGDVIVSIEDIRQVAADAARDTSRT